MKFRGWYLLGELAEMCGDILRVVGFRGIQYTIQTLTMICAKHIYSRRYVAEIIDSASPD